MMIATLEEHDYLNAQKLHRRWSKRKFIVIISLVIVVLVMCWIFWCKGFLLIAGGVIGGLIGGTIAGATTRYVYIPWKARRVFRQQKSLQREYSMSWNADGIQTKNKNGENSSSWSEFIRWKENENLFLLYISDIQFYMFPKRAFTNETELNDFRAHLVRSVHV